MDDGVVARQRDTWRSRAGLVVLGLLATTTPGPLAFHCPFHELTGLWCPGCGSTRAVLALLRLDVPAAIAAQPLLPIAVAGLLLLRLSAVRGLLADPQHRLIAVRAALLLVVAFGVARNLPLPAARLLAPP